MQIPADRFVSAYTEEVFISLPTQLSPASVLWYLPLGVLGSSSITHLSYIFNSTAGFSLQASCSQLAWGKPLPWPLSSSSSCVSLMPSQLNFQKELLFAVPPEVGSGYSSLKSQQRGKFGGKESMLYFGCCQPVGGGWGVVGEADSCPKANSLPLPPDPCPTSRLRERATCRNSTISCDSHLEIGHRWSGQDHLDCLVEYS